MRLLRASDDRDRSVTIRGIDALGRPSLPRVRLRRAALLAAAKRTLRFVFSGPVILGIGAVLLVSELLALTLAQGPTGLYVALASPVSVLLITLVFMGVRTLWLAPGLCARLACEGALRKSRCPSCGYGLRGVKAEDDERVVCPECGAAWKASRIGAEREEGQRVVVISDWPSTRTG